MLEDYRELRSKLIASKTELLQGSEALRLQTDIHRLRSQLEVKTAASESFNGFKYKWTTILDRIGQTNEEYIKNPSKVDPEAENIVNEAQKSRIGLSIASFDAEFKEMNEMLVE